MPFTTRRNLCPNPNFEGNNATGWSAYTGVAAPTASSVGPVSGTYRGSAVGNNTTTVPRVALNYNGGGPFIPGRGYTAQVKIKPVGTWPGGQQVYFAVRWQTTGAEKIDILNVTFNPDSSGWMFATVVNSICPPDVKGAGQTALIVNVGMVCSTNLTSAGELAWDEFCIEESSTLQPYFDGSSSRDGYRYAWTGAIAGSESTEEKISDSAFRRNTVRNPKLRANLTDYANSAGTSGVVTQTRMTDGNLTIPETGQLIPNYYRTTWTTPAVGVASTGPLYGSTTQDAANVIGGQNCTISAYMRTNHADRNVKITVGFHDPAGNLIGGLATNPAHTLIGGGGWVRISYTALVPIGATRAFIRFYGSAGTDFLVNEWVDITAVMVEITDTVQSYFDGDSPAPSQSDRIYWATLATPDASQSIKETAASAALLPRRNISTNPSSETPGAGWQTNNAANWVMTDDTTVFHSGTKSKLSTPQAAVIGASVSLCSYSRIGAPAPDHHVSPGDILTCSVYVRHTADVDAKVTLRGIYYDAAQVSLGFNMDAIFTVPSGVWTRVYVTTLQAPSNAVSLRILLFGDRVSGNVKAGEFFWADDCLVNVSATLVRDYFDGSSPAANGYSYQWVGTPDASESIEINTAPETRRNIAPNPGVQLNTTYWAINPGGGTNTSALIDAPDGPATKKAFRVTWTGLATSDTGGIYQGGSGSRYINVRDAATISASVYVRSNRAQCVSIYWYAYDVANTLKGNSFGSPFTLNPNEWTRITCPNIRLPAGSDHLIIACYSRVGTGFSRWDNGNTFDVQGMLVESSSVVGTYFDGDGPNTSLATARWMGMAYGSDSVLSAGSSNNSRNDSIYAGLVAGGYYSLASKTTTLVDMERKRLLSKLGLSEPQRLSLRDLYVKANESPRIKGFKPV